MANSNPNQNGGSLASISHLIGALNDMQNELVKTSLVLKEHQIYLHSVQRIVAAHAKNLVVEVKLP